MKLFFFRALAFALVCFNFAPQAYAAPQAPQLMVWVRADDLSALKDGDRVSRWVDASGQGRDLKAEGDARPTYRADAVAGKPGVVFEKKSTPASQFMTIPLAGEWSGATVFVVGQKLTSWGWFDSLPGLEGDLRVLGYVQLTGTKVSVDSGFPDLAKFQGAQITSMRVGFDAAGEMRLTTFANGKQQATAADPNPRFGIGWRADRSRIGSELFDGSIAEVLIYKGALSDPQREQVEQYLSAKYGVTTDANAPRAPLGYPVPSLVKAVKPAPPVKGAPVRDGLQLWLRADDVKGVNENALVDEVPNAMGGEPARSEGRHRPHYVTQSLNGRPVLRFKNDNTTPREEVQWLQLPPSLQGMWPEATVFVAGRKLLNAGVLDTAPGSADTLRHIGPIQHTIPALTLHDPFPFLRLKQHGPLEPIRTEGQISTLTVGKLGEAGQYIATWADGQRQARSDSPDQIAPILFRDAHLGTNNRGEARFDGDIGEVLIYNRALSEAERKQTEIYLAQKWGVPLRTPQQVAQIENARSQWSLALPTLPHTQSWFGNTLSGRPEVGWVQSGMTDITALPDGRVAAISVWDEQHKEIGFYKDGKAAGGLKTGGGAITNDEKFLYAAVSGYDKLYAGVRRLTLDGKDAPWPGLPETDFPGWGKFQAIRFDIPKAWTEANSLVVSGGELFLSVNNMDDIRVYDAATGAPKRTVPLKNPGKLAVDKAGRLWVGQIDTVLCFNADGTPNPAKISGVSAGGLAVDSRGLLWVADNGTRQQLIGYDVSGAQPIEIKTLGEKGGVYSGPRPGQLTDSRIIPPRALAIESSGNFLVLGENVLRCYAPEGAVKWTLECTSFTTTSDFDPSSDGNIIYTGRERYDYVPGAPPGKDWKLTGFTSDPRRFPELAQGGEQSILRRIGGQLLRYSINQPIIIHRQEKNSDLFVPAAIVTRPAGDFHPAIPRPKAAPEGRFAWSDRNGNGLVEENEFSLPAPDAKPTQASYSCWVDSEGGIWEPMDREGFRYMPLKEVTAAGVPVYDMAQQKWFDKPKEFIQVLRVLYVPRTDTLILTGTTWNNPAVGTEWWGMSGREVVCYADWSKPTRRVLWRTPFHDGALNIKAISVAPAANLFFAGVMESETVFVYDLRTGKLHGILEPDKTLVGDIGWIDIEQGIRPFTRQNGEVLVLVEEVWGQKQMVYRIKPLKAGRGD